MLSNLSDRKKQILISIVEAYTENKKLEPIGSSELLKRIGMDVSTATLRNDMAELEELGYLEKTHTSSGRIPTEKGYRLYVDELVHVDDIVDDVEKLVRYYMDKTNLPKRQAIEQAMTDLLNEDQVNYSALMLEKTAYNSKIRKIDFVHVKGSQGIFLLVTDKGHIFHNEVSVPEVLNQKNIEKTVEFFNENLQGVLLNDFKYSRSIKFNSNGYFDYMNNAEAIIEFVLLNIDKLLDDKRQILCPYNILNHDDFSDINFAQGYLSAIKNEEIYQMIDFDNGPLPVIGNNEGANISIKVGSEHNNPILNNFSSITAYYSSNDGTGAITIYGPMRMKYKSVIAMLTAIVHIINEN